MKEQKISGMAIKHEIERKLEIGGNSEVGVQLISVNNVEN